MWGLEMDFMRWVGVHSNKPGCVCGGYLCGVCKGVLCGGWAHTPINQCVYVRVSVWGLYVLGVRCYVLDVYVLCVMCVSVKC